MTKDEREAEELDVYELLLVAITMACLLALAVLA